MSDDYETQDIKQASGNKLTTTGRTIVISIVSVLCFILIFIIIRELCLCYRFSQPTGIRVGIDDIAEIDSVRVEWSEPGVVQELPKWLKTINLLPCINEFWNDLILLKQKIP